MNGGGRRAWVVVLLMALFAVSACEDDPILDPTGEPEDEGGSYGRLQLGPASSVGSADALDPSETATNPKLF